MAYLSMKIKKWCALPIKNRARARAPLALGTGTYLLGAFFVRYKGKLLPIAGNFH